MEEEMGATEGSRRVCCEESQFSEEASWWEEGVIHGGKRGVREDKGGSHTLGRRGRRPGEAGQAQRNPLGVGRGSVLGSAGPVRAREMPPALWWGGASPTGSPAGLQAQPWHLNE